MGYEKKCIVCGSVFMAERSYAKYCSNRCKCAAFSHGIAKPSQSKQKVSDNQILECIANGMTRIEIADLYGIHVENLAKRMARLGVHAKNSIKEPGYKHPNLNTSGLKHPAKIYGECWHYVPSQAEMVKERHPHFQYLETQNKSSTTRMRLRCCECGEIIERDASTVRCKNLKCDNCEKKRIEQIELEQERVRLIRSFYLIKEIKTPKECARCGKEFYSQYPEQKYCSKKCKSKNNSIRGRCRKYGVYYDSSVTSLKIFKRDGYICKICGLACDAHDKSWNGFLGPYSPTVDHIIALANGGTHTWDNVQCAHAICNSYKRDLYTG
jgi:hypothetical protein